MHAPPPNAAPGFASPLVLSPDDKLPPEDAALFAEVSAALAPRIQVVSMLGRGGMGVVFLARDPLLKRSLAVKVLAPAHAGSEVARARFMREAQAAATIAHPNVVGGYDVGQLPSGVPFFLMQFIDGKNLAALKTDGPFAEARARRVVGEVASALAAAHARGFVHRDVKPSNVIVDNESGRAMVLDFGISAALETSPVGGEGTLTALGTYVGTPTYTSPEQASSDKVSGKSDVYSLGVMAFELLTGSLPFKDTQPMALLAAHIKDVPPPVRTLRPDLEPQFASLVDRCLAKDPAQRPEANEIARFLVPEPQAAIEWPPPGLDELRGLAARAISAFNVLGAIAVLWIVVLTSQPTRATAAWPNYEASIVWSMFANIGGGNPEAWRSPDATPMWLLALELCSFVTIIVFVVFAARSARLLSRVRHGRRQGYPTSVLLSVAVDKYTDTAQLFNRSGPFAMLSTEQQRRVIVGRRLRVALPGLGFALTLAMIAVWALVPWGHAYAVELLSPTVALLLALPATLGVLDALYHSFTELQLRGGMRRRGRDEISAQRRAFSRDWLKRVGQSATAPVYVPGATTLVPAVMVAIGALMLVGMIFVGVAVLSSTRVVVATRGDAGESPWRYAYAQSNRSVDSAIATLARRLRPTADDSSARELLAAGALQHIVEGYANKDSATIAASIGDAWPQYVAARDAYVQFAAHRKLPPHEEESFAIIWQARRGEFPADSVLARTTRQAASAWGPVLRRFARSNAGTPPFFYPTPALLRGNARSLYITWWNTPGMTSVIAQYTLARKHRQWAAAREIGLELVHAGGRLVHSPRPEENQRGSIFLDVGGAMLREVGRVTSDASLLNDANELESAIRTANNVRRPTSDRRDANLWAFSGDVRPGSKAFLAIADRNLRQHERWDIIAAGVTGFCLNSREILFGVSPVRLELLDRAGELARDIPRTDEWIAAQKELLDQWIESPSTAILTGYVRPPHGLLAWIAPGFAARLRYCEARVNRL